MDIYFVFIIFVKKYFYPYKSYISPINFILIFLQPLYFHWHFKSLLLFYLFYFNVTLEFSPVLYGFGFVQGVGNSRCYTFPPQTMTIVFYGARNIGYDDDDEKKASEKKRELQIIK